MPVKAQKRIISYLPDNEQIILYKKQQMPRISKAQQSDMQESPFKEQDHLQITDTEIKQLFASKKKFNEFVDSLGDNAAIPLTQGNLRYSKEILPTSIQLNDILQLVGTRVDKMLKNRRIKRNWGKEDCTILAWVLQKLTNGRHLKCPEKLKLSYWQAASEVIPGSAPDECMFKWLSMKKIKLENHKWESDECRILQKLVEEWGTNNWKRISRELYIRNISEERKFRHPKQCREQWNCYLNPVLKKGPWQPEEDIKLLSMVLEQGGRRKWSDFSKNIEGRTENALKNRFSFLLQNFKEKNHDKSDPEMACVEQCLAEIRQKLRSPCKQETTFEEGEKSPQSNFPASFLQPTRNAAEDISMILSGDISTTAFKKPVACEKQEGDAKYEKDLPTGIKMPDLLNFQIDGEQKLQVKQCSIDEIVGFMKKNNNQFLIPAKLGKNMQLEALFPHHLKQ